MEKGKIIQIMPADGWHEVYWENKGSDETTVKVFSMPLIGWALVERMESRTYAEYEDDESGYVRDVEPVSSSGDYVEVGAEDESNFLGFWHPGMGPLDETWGEDGVRAWQREQKKKAGKK